MIVFANTNVSVVVLWWKVKKPNCVCLCFLLVSSAQLCGAYNYWYAQLLYFICNCQSLEARCCTRENGLCSVSTCFSMCRC